MFLPPKISSEDSLRLLKKPSRFFLKKTPVIKSELLFMPNYLFEIEVTEKQKTAGTSTVSVDGIKGEFAFFHGGDLIENIDIPSRKYPFLINADRAEEIVKKNYNHYITSRGLKNRSRMSINSVKLVSKFYYPFWIGYFKKKGAIDFKVIDGISGEFEGIKMKSVFIDMLLINKKAG